MNPSTALRSPVSLRLGHATALTAIQAVIHYRVAASLPLTREADEESANIPLTRAIGNKRANTYHVFGEYKVLKLKKKVLKPNKKSFKMFAQTKPPLLKGGGPRSGGGIHSHAKHSFA